MAKAGLPVLLSVLMLALGAGMAKAADCPQEKAVYNQAGGSFRLAFKPVGSDAAVMVNRFELVVDRQVFTGFVMESEEPTRSVLRIENKCPDGDVTGEDLAACTLFEGYAYAIGAAGETGPLPKGSAKAAPHLLLAGFAPVLLQSPVNERLHLPLPVSDSFDFRECAP